MGMPAFVYRWYFGAHGLKSLQRNILGFVGVRPVRSSLIGMVEAIGAKKRERWLARMYAFGADGR
jgi:putative NADPH-quinone reductase